MTRVFGSCSMYSMRSQTSRSDWLPSDTQTLKPMPLSWARSNIETISAPLWLTRPTWPRGISSGSSTREDVRASGCQGLIRPMQLGPMMCMPAARASPAISASMRAPSGPASAKPVVMTTAQRPPARPHSRSAGRRTSRPTASKATSTGPASVIEG